MPAALELAPKLAVVVDLPVLDDVDGAVLVPDRLVTGLEGDDRETARGERGPSVGALAEAVRAAVDERLAHRREPADVGGAVRRGDSADPAHPVESRETLERGIVESPFGVKTCGRRSFQGYESRPQHPRVRHRDRRRHGRHLRDFGDERPGGRALARAALAPPAHQAAEELAEHTPSGRRERAEVETNGPVGDPLEVVRELLRHRRLVAAPDLREACEPRRHDEPLPVRRQVGCELLEEAGSDRPRPDEAHVAAEDVPELWDLVELRRAQPSAERRRLGLGPPDELLAEVWPESLFRAAA